MWMLLSPILIWAKGISAKVWGYVVLVGAIISAAFMLYYHGKEVERQNAEHQTLEQDAANRREAEAIRDRVNNLDDPVKRLREQWTRPRD